MAMPASRPKINRLTCKPTPSRRRGSSRTIAEFERQIIAQRTSAGIAALRARRKDKSWGPKVYMTPDRIKRVGELLNGGMTGPKVAEKLGVSTASVYGHWKQVGKGRFVRKRPADRKRKEI